MISESHVHTCFSLGHIQAESEFIYCLQKADWGNIREVIIFYLFLFFIFLP